MNRKLKKNISYVLLVVFTFIALAGSISVGLNTSVKAATTTLNPVADTDTQSDVAGGTNAALNASEWCHAFFKFNLATIGGTVTDAKFRIYHQNHVTNATLLLNNASPDSWVEGGTKPTTGTNITSMPITANGYMEFNVTSLVNTESAGDDLVTFSLTASTGSPWQNFSSREGAYKPELVVTYGGTSTPTVAPTATPAAGTIGNTTDGTSTDNTAANYYNAIRYQASSNMTVTQMKIKMASAGTGKMKCAIYSDNAGNPGTFLKGTNELTNLGAGWQTLPLTSSQALTSGTYYWLVSWRDSAYQILSTTSTGCNWWGSLAYTASWPTNLPAKGGQADLRHSFYASTGATPTPGPTATPTPASTNTPTPAATATPTPATGTMKLGTNFWNKQWHPSSDYFPTGINWATVTNPWKPEFIADLAPFSNLRFMDLVPVNNSNVVNWSERVQKTSDHYTSVGFAIEWMIDLCNRTNKDMWICIPHKSTYDYWFQCATLIKNTLNSNLKCYVEYSNETWNYGFTQAQYCEDQGVAGGLPGSNKWYQGGAYSVWQSTKIFKAFRDAFGSQMSSRVVRVCAFSGNFDIFDQGYNSVVNSGTWNPNGEAADIFAVAPYINGSLDGADASIQSKFHAEIDNMKNSYVIPAKNIANKYGKPLCCYEGGQHLLTNAHLWSRNPAIYNEYLYMLNSWKPYFTLFDHYCQYATAASGGAWGAKESLTQLLSDAHKYRALVDWKNSNP